MDPVSALGIAAAVLQFTDFTGRLLSETWRVYRTPTGQTSGDFELKVVASDLAKLTSIIQSHLAPDALACTESADAGLLELCHECNSIAADLQGTVTEAVNRDESLQKPKKSVSAGDAFRIALSALWNRKKIESVKRSLDDIHRRLLNTVTTSIWLGSQETKAWELQFSKKLDHAIQTLESAVNESGESGPQMNNTKSSSVQRLESQISDAVHGNRINDNAVRLIWNRHWAPDTTLLSDFPKNTNTTPELVGSAIARTLQYETIDHRDEAIPHNYKATYEWVFERRPNVVDGMPAWSSVPDWLETGDSGVYWVTGKPGSGKSTMMKFMMLSSRLKEHLRVWSEGLPLHVGHYYAWNSGKRLDKSKEGLMRSVLHQIISANPRLVAVLCPRRWTLFHATRDPLRFPEWSQWELDEAFTALLKHTKNDTRLFLFIDGLDEFDTAPKSIVDLILRVAAKPFIKVCASSRPWPEFQDAFLGCPSMQMHRLTEDDICTFTNLRLHQSPGFLEMVNIYPGQIRMLIDDIIRKSNGVFLWTAIVTQNLLESLGEGAHLYQLRNILDQLPSDIEKLYDAILVTVPQRLLPEMTAMLLIYKAACQPLPWFTMWLADEFRGANLDHNAAIVSHDSRHKALHSLQRRLAARTRGLLEVSGPNNGQSIGYLHRTVTEWTQRPGVWERIVSKASPDFDPYMCLFTAEMLLMCPNPSARSDQREELRKTATRSLFYASLCRFPSVNMSETQFVAALDLLNARAQKAIASILVEDDYEMLLPWTQAAAPPRKMNNFLGLAAQFCIAPYVRANVEKKSQQFKESHQPSFCGLFDQVVLGPQGRIRPYALGYLEMNKIEEGSRLRLLEFLIQHKVPSTPELRETISRAGGNKFFQDVAGLMGLKPNIGRKNSVRTRFKSMLNKAK